MGEWIQKPEKNLCIDCGAELRSGIGIYYGIKRAWTRCPFEGEERHQKIRNLEDLAEKTGVESFEKEIEKLRKDLKDNPPFREE